MTHKKILSLVLVCSIVVFFLSLVFGLPERFGLCAINDDACIYSYLDYQWITGFLLFFSATLTLVCFLLFLTKEEVFRTWSKFIIWWIPLSAALLYVTPEYQGGWGISFPLDREIVLWFTSGSFLLVSLIIIIRKWWQVRRGDTAKA